MAALGRNGFRIGLAKRDSWPDLARIFKRLTGQQTKESTFLRVPGAPIEVVLKEQQPGQTIFTVNDDRTISGEDYPPADNLLTLLCTFNQDEPNHVLLIGAETAPPPEPPAGTPPAAPGGRGGFGGRGQMVPGSFTILVVGK